jgi:hypothetical protein
VMPAVSKRDFKFRSDHPSFITWSWHVRWSAFAAFRPNLHRIAPVIGRFCGEAGACRIAGGNSPRHLHGAQ